MVNQHDVIVLINQKCVIAQCSMFKLYIYIMRMNYFLKVVLIRNINAIQLFWVVIID